MDDGDNDFANMQEGAAERANKILESAIAFADEVKVHDESMIEAVFRTIVAKHVDAQLHFLEGGQNYELSRVRAAFEKLAHAHANEGVRVKMTQPWHNSDRDRNRD